MRFYTSQHIFYCGIDPHARLMSVCIMDQEKQILVHWNMDATVRPLEEVTNQYRNEMAPAVEYIFTWYWIADLCVWEGMNFVLGHTQYMKAIHAGMVKNDKIFSQKIAALLGSGMFLFPMDFVCPQAMRSTRDPLRRRLYLTRQHAELHVHIRNTNMQYNLPDFQKRIDRKFDRIGMGTRFTDPAVRTGGSYQYRGRCGSHGRTSRADPHEMIAKVETGIGQGKPQKPQLSRQLRPIPFAVRTRSRWSPLLLPCGPLQVLKNAPRRRAIPAAGSEMK